MSVVDMARTLTIEATDSLAQEVVLITNSQPRNWESDNSHSGAPAK